MVNVETAVNEFLLGCEADNLSKATIRWYRSILGQFSQIHQIRVNEVAGDHMRRYIVSLRKQGYAEDSVGTHIRALHRFWAWAAKEYELANPMRTIRYPQKPQPQPKGASLDDIAAMFEAANVRDRAIIAFLLDTGCRAGGLVSLNMNDLDLEQRRALVTEKGNKTRMVVFTTYTHDILLDWLKERHPAPTLFYNLDTLEPLTVSGLRQLLQRLAKRAGVKGRFNPHSFRHTFAREYMSNGGDLATLAKLLGHRDVGTTVSHYAVFSDSEIKEKHEQFSPVRKLMKGTEDG